MTTLMVGVALLVAPTVLVLAVMRWLRRLLVVGNTERDED